MNRNLMPEGEFSSPAEAGCRVREIVPLAPPAKAGGRCFVSRHFDAIIIGTGQAGPSLAARLSAAGMAVAIIERHKFGGTCVNTGCTPTKTLVASAYAAHMARRGADYGVIVEG